MMRLLKTAFVISGAALLFVSPARAYTIGSGFGAGCHERITANAFEPFLVGVGGVAIIPESGDEDWRRVGAYLAGQVDVDPVDLSESEYFILTSLLVGVRSRHRGTLGVKP